MFVTADWMMAGIIVLVFIIGLLVMRRVKKDVVEPMVKQPRIFVVHSGRGLPSGRRLIGAPPGGGEDVVEGQYRQI